MIESCPLDPSDLDFPLQCHYRVIAEDHERLVLLIESVLRELGVDAPVVRGNCSRNGTYVSYGITTVVESRESMNRIDAGLRGVPGVRMVL